MRNCFDLEAKRCHSYRTTPARIVPRPFLYACSCREHRLTSIMHNKIGLSYQALCKACRTPLQFVDRAKILTGVFGVTISQFVTLSS